jgi:hypothetical protein
MRENLKAIRRLNPNPNLRKNRNLSPNASPYLIRNP